MRGWTSAVGSQHMSTDIVISTNVLSFPVLEHASVYDHAMINCRINVTVKNSQSHLAKACKMLAG